MILILIIIISFFQNQGIITSNSLDEIKIGMLIDDFYRFTDTSLTIKKESIKLEGDLYDIYNVYSKDTLVFAVEPDCEDICKIWRIWLYSPHYKTMEGIGVGNTLGDLKEKYTIKSFNSEEGSVSVSVEQIDLGFQMDSKNIPDTWWSNQSLKGLSDSLKIDLIIIM